MVTRDTLCKIKTRSVVSTTTAAKGSRKQVLAIQRLRRLWHTEVDRYIRVVSFCSRHEYANLRACSPIRPHTLADYFLFCFFHITFLVGASRFHSPTFSAIVILLFPLLSRVCLFVWHRPTTILVFLSFGIHSLPSSMFSSVRLPLSFSPHLLAISVTLLLWYH